MVESIIAYMLLAFSANGGNTRSHTPERLRRKKRARTNRKSEALGLVAPRNASAIAVEHGSEEQRVVACSHIDIALLPRQSTSTELLDGRNDATYTANLGMLQASRMPLIDDRP